MRWLKRIIMIVAMLVLLVLGAAFSAQNGDLVTLDLLIAILPPTRLATLILISFALGGLAGMVTASAAMMRVRMGLHTLQRRLQASEQELHRLRAMTKS